MSSDTTDKTFEGLDLSKDEVKRLGEALKDEKFRKMLVEYAEEISNPENRRKAEEEIAQLENERGMSVQFIHPLPGYVLKTTVNGSKKAFVNICQNDKIEKPKAQKQVGPDGKRGVMWQIPHSFAPPRDDHDKTHVQCQVFDVVFHPDTYRMAMSNERFKKLVEDTAVDGIESQFGVTLDKKNIRRPKMTFKGTPQATVIRERLTQQEAKESSNDDDILNKMPYPYDNKTSSEKANENQLKHEEKRKSTASAKETNETNKFTVPKYTITHVSEVDFSEYRNSPDAKTSTCPNALVIKIELPLLNSAAQASLDIFEKRLTLESVTPAAYKLDLSLPYSVNEDDGSAKFDKSKRTLTVTLPVVRPKTPPLPFSNETEKCDEYNFNAPLIESISSVTESDSCDSKSSTQLNDILNCTSSNVVQSCKEDDNTVNNYRTLTSAQNVKWILPSYQFSQDNETVSFVISVKNIEEKTVEKMFPKSCAACVQFMSIGAGCFPVYYKLYTQFPEECVISSDHCSIDVSTNNLVFIILKDKKCRGLWDSFNIGIDDSDLEERQFLTESNLQKELFDLDKEAEETIMPGQVEEMPGLSVVEMTEKRLTIDIKPPNSRKWKLPVKTDEEDEEEYDPPSSADIEVIHKHPLPDLHSILKQRSVSESSEEISNGDPDSPRSEGEELSSSYNKKRSVSFSSYVDHASFKSFASVSSMTPGLKSKRRRQRKRDEKKNGRVRYNSGGTSSSEECLHSVSDSYSYSEEEFESSNSRNKGGRKAVLHRAISDPGPNIENLSVESKREKGAGEPCKRDKRKNKKSGSNVLIHKSDHVSHNSEFSVKSDSLSSGEVINDPPHSVDVVIDKDKEIHLNKNMVNNEEITINKKNQKMVSEIREKLAKEQVDGKSEQTEDSDDDHFVDAVSSLIEDFNSKVICEDKPINGAVKNVCSTPDNDVKTSLVNEIEPLVSSEPVDQGDASAKNDRCDVSNIDYTKDVKSDVETILSWEDRGVSHEHETKCAFQFSNSVMFDLDVD